MTRRLRSILGLLSASAPLALNLACSLNIKVPQIPTAKTELEAQVIGSYREIDDELIMISTVRGDDPAAAPGAAGLDDKVKLARQNQKFNLDDVEELKNAQVLGEANDGSLVLVPSSVSRLEGQAATSLRMAELLIAEENADRSLIWQEILNRQANPDASKLGEVRKGYASLKQKESKVGQWYQSQNGEWVRKVNEQ